MLRKRTISAPAPALEMVGFFTEVSQSGSICISYGAIRIYHTVSKSHLLNDLHAAVSMPKPEFRNFPESTTSFMSQLERDDGPVVLINVFEVPPDKYDTFVEYWQADVSFMKAQHGMLSGQLHKGIGESNIYIDVAHWESAPALSRAFKHPDSQNSLTRCPKGVTAYPVVRRKLSVLGICVA